MKRISKIMITFLIMLMFAPFTSLFTNEKNITPKHNFLTVYAEEEAEEEPEEEAEEEEAEEEPEEELDPEPEVDEENENPYLYDDETGTLQVQTRGVDLKADIYLVIQDSEENEATIYISPYRDSKNERRFPAGKYTTKEIFLLDEDYKDYYRFKHNEELIVFPNEKVYFNIDIAEAGKNEADDLLFSEEIEVDEETEETDIESTEDTDNNSIDWKSIGIGAGVVAVIVVLIVGGLYYVGFFHKE